MFRLFLMINITSIYTLNRNLFIAGCCVCIFFYFYLFSFHHSDCCNVHRALTENQMSNVSFNRCFISLSLLYGLFDMFRIFFSFYFSFFCLCMYLFDCMYASQSFWIHFFFVYDRVCACSKKYINKINMCNVHFGWPSCKQGNFINLSMELKQCYEYHIV